MRRILFILSFLCMVSMVSALEITNGDFEEGDTGWDVPSWYETDPPSPDNAKGPWVYQGSAAVNDTQVLFMPQAQGYCYQYIGDADGTHSIDISFEWAPSHGTGGGGDVGISFMILESDGTFVPGEETDVYNATGITVLDEVSQVQTVDISDGPIYETWTLDLTGATPGNELYFRIYNTTEEYMSIDNITMVPSPIANQLPAKDDTDIPVAHTASENSLVFTVVDPNGVIGAVDVLFGLENEPNLSLKSEYKIVDDLPVSQGNQYTVTHDNDLDNDRDYYWRVIAYDPNGMEMDLVYTGPVWSFHTVSITPHVSAVNPAYLAIDPEQDAVFSVTSANVDTYQWYKDEDPDPDTPLYDTNPKYTIVSDSVAGTSTLTVHDVESADEGFYYCVGADSEMNTDTSDPTGKLVVKDLKSYYPFDSTYDDGGNTMTPDIVGGYDAQLMGGANVTDTDPIGGTKSLLLNNPGGSQTQFAQIASSAVADYENITISVWVKPTTLEAWTRVLEFGENSTNYAALIVPYKDYSVRLQCQFDSEDEVELDGVLNEDIATDEWLFVTFTIDESDKGRMYVNGEYGYDSEVDNSGEKGLHNNLTDLNKVYNLIGKSFVDTSSANFNGLIDDLKIYNYARTSEQIAQDYLAVRTDIEFICNRETYDLQAYDFNSDCQIDLSDFAEIASRWLNSHRIYTVD